MNFLASISTHPIDPSWFSLKKGDNFITGPQFFLKKEEDCNYLYETFVNNSFALCLENIKFTFHIDLNSKKRNMARQ